MKEERPEVSSLLLIDGETTNSNDWPERQRVMYEQADYLGWANICFEAYKRAENLVLKIWLLLEFVNGYRRQPGIWSIERATQWLDEAHHLIVKLGHHPQNKRLQSIWAYQRGMVYHLSGEFYQAADCHHLAVEIASDHVERTISEYMVAYENLNDAIFNNDQISQRSKNYEIVARRLLKAFKGNDSQNQLRWYANVLCHRAVFAWLDHSVDKVPRFATKALAFLKTHPQIPASAFADALVVMQAMQTGKLVETKRIWGDADWLAAARLWNVYHLPQVDDWKPMLQQIINDKTLMGGRLFKNQAARQLAVE
ncbi:MAG: hypothetical protein WCV73_03765 [Patescibacteria group bacterium]|jgi:hypothetical protein